MANLSDFLTQPVAAKPQDRAGPGSNGYWRREIFSRRGTHTWTAKKRGRVKVQGLGAGAAGFSTRAGPSGAFGEKEFMVEAGQTLTFVVGGGGAMQASTSVAGGNGETSSVSGAPIGGTPLTLIGAVAPTSTANANAVEGRATGPWDLANPGAVAAPQAGGPSSGSPFGPGNVSSGDGAAGWGGGAGRGGGASSHYPNTNDAKQSGLFATVPGEVRTFWDMRDFDAAGTASGDSSNLPGPGAGSGANNTFPQPSLIGGGTGRNTGTNYDGGPGGIAAGGGPGNTANWRAGPGGNAIFFLFFDEVQ